MNEKYYVELTINSENTLNPDYTFQSREVLVRCDSEAIALKVVQHLRYAKNIHEEMTNTVLDDIVSIVN